ncbi:hypothetical protein Q7C36_023079 [Tachysurus vachellii]|uniref:Uncharacterized protein n=1 Tax=Tachysurus vachellii TaxID=175792 RepID=A0AA88LF45_TACVA|nr:hypothetical protein Q7C36_023079 [Tachysurus vachellii]
MQAFRRNATKTSKQQKIRRRAKSFSYHRSMHVPLFRREQKPGLNHSMTPVSQTRVANPIDQKACEIENTRPLRAHRGFRRRRCLFRSHGTQLITGEIMLQCGVW